MAKNVRISDLVLRDAHQSLHATRMTTADMLPICPKLDKVGYFALEAWGGATFDSCIRFLNEDPWHRLRSLKKALPDTPLMMLLRGQNLLGYRHYADDVVDHFVEAAAKNGVDVFRIFDALNDPRNLARATAAAKKTGKHVQLTISYATTPVHTLDAYADLAKAYAETGADSICIKDMAGLLKPYDAYELVKSIKKRVDIPVEVHTHATTGMSVATLIKAAEAGADILDTAISSMSMGTSHSPTEAIVEILQGTEMDTGLDIKLLLEIAEYFREVRKKYAKFESSFLGADTRILVSQVPGGMLSNLESQLKEQGAADRIDEVLREIPVVQKDCGYIPLVTPTSQIVGTQAVFNVLFGRYNRLTAETRDLLVGKYGKTTTACNPDLVKKALTEMNMEAAITHRPADDLANEFEKLRQDAAANGAADTVEDVLTYAMFPKVAPKFFAERSKGPVSFEAPSSGPGAGTAAVCGGSFVVNVNGTDYSVLSAPSGESLGLTVNGTAYTVTFKATGTASAAPAAAGGADITSPVAGTLLKHVVPSGTAVKSGQTIVMIESMKMELEVKATADGLVQFTAQPGTALTAGQVIATIGGGASTPAPAPGPAPASAGAAAMSTAQTGGVTIPAPVAGTLLRHIASEGAVVSPGATIMIIESMKMELEIKATAAGSIHYVASPGSQIMAGQILAEIK